MGSALERLRAIDTTETDKKRTASVQARLAAARTEATAKRTVAASGGILDRVTSDVKKTTAKKKTTTKPTKVKSEQKSASTLGDALKRSWDVAAEYANTGTLNKKKIREAAESKLDLGGATKSLLKGAAKSTGASMTNAASTLLKALDTGTVRGKSREELVTTRKPETVERVQKAADRLAVSADKDIAIARETLGDLVTDVGVGLVQLGGDMAAGVIVPGGALISLSARAFGGKAQQVRQKGGSIDAQVAAGTTAAVTEFLIEKLFSVGKFQSKYFGEGAVDDILEGVVAAVEDLGKTESGKAWLNHLATGGMNFLTEGVEEGLSGMLEPVADRIIGKLDGYEDKPLNWKEIGQEAGHAFLVGGIIGALGGTVSGTDTGKGRETGVQVAQTGFAAETGKDIPSTENPAQARGVGRVTVDYEQFRKEYAKRVPETTEEQTREQFELFKGYASGQDVVDTAQGTMTRAEIKERLAGLQDEKEIDRVVDGLLDEQEAKQAQARYFGEKAGLVKDENWKKAHLSSRDERRLDALGKVLGTEIRFAETINDGSDNAKYENGVITLALDAEDPVMTSVIHEAVHRLKEMDGELYGQLSRFVQANMSDQMIRRNLDFRSELYETSDQNVLTEELVADAFGVMLKDGAALDQLVKDDRTAVEKLLDVVRDIINAVHRALNDQNLKLSQAQQDSFRDLSGQLGEMEKQFEDALKRVANSQPAIYNGSTKYSKKEGEYNDRTGTERTYAREIRQYDTGGEGGNGEASQRDGGSRSLSTDGRLREVSAEFGQEPFRAWARAGIVNPTAGSVSHSEQQIAMEFGVPSYVVSDDVWAKNRLVKNGKQPAPAFSVNGQIYLQETMPEKYRGSFAIHEVVHVMAQVHYAPYLDFIAKTPDALNMQHIDTWTLLDSCAKHCGVDLFAMSDGDDIRLYDELNATIVGSLAIKDSALSQMKDVFFDFDAHTAELMGIVEQFKQRNRGKASKKGRAQLDEYITKYGAIPKGENPVRDIQMPKRTSDDKKLSQTVRTVMEAAATPENMLPDIEQLAAEGAFSFESYTDKQAIQDAADKIGGDHGVGWTQAYSQWSRDMGQGKVSKENTTLGWTLYNHAANSGDTKLALDILDQMVRHQRSAAQALQATRILKKLSPETQLYQVQRSVQSLQEELNKKYGKKGGPELKVDGELAEQLLAAENQEARDEVLKDIYRDIGKQIPSRFVDKWNAWRYLAMLGNPRTHVRNVIGNAGFAPVVAVKDLTATAIESAVSRVSGGRLERTKGVVALGKSDRALLKAAWGDYAGVAEAAMSGGKYDDLASANKYIDEGRKIFKTKPLEATRKGNSNLLEKEDVWFSQPHYAYAMAQYCKANSITAEQVARGEGLDKARDYAVKEAQKATYRDSNAFSKFVAELGRRADSNQAAKAANVALEGILPFRKTPANILVRGVEYSPIGLVKSLSYDMYQMKQGNKTGAEVIDGISAGLTGTGLLALGVFLASQGMVRGSGEGDDKEKEFDELQGHQAYSLEAGGTSVTLDWLAPECLPFFVGVNLWEQSQGEAATLSDWLDALKNVSEPMLEMSCLQSLNDAFDSVANAVTYGNEKGLTAFVTSAATSYVTQCIPTLGGQIERSAQADRMTTYTGEESKWLTSDMQYTIGKASGRLPGDYNQIPYIDAWGRKETEENTLVRVRDNMVNPAYMSTIQTSEMEQELERLYKATGESVFPSRASQSFNVEQEKKELTGEEYVEYATRKGQMSYELVTELTDSELYQSMADADKAEAVGEVYSYANAIAKTAVSKYQPDGWIAKARECEEKDGIPVITYILAHRMTSGIESIKDKNGDTVTNSKGLRIMETVYSVPGLTAEQVKKLAEDLGAGKTVLGYSEKMVRSKLAAMEKKYG